MIPSSRHLLGALLIGALTLTGCRETLEPGARPLGAVPADRYQAQVVVSPTGSSDRWLARVSLTGGAATTRMAGFRARLVLPSSLVVDGDVNDQSAAQGALMRIVRVDGSDVHATGASAEGIAMGDLFVVSVRGPATALSQLRVELEELVDVHGDNRLSRATVLRFIDDSRIRR